MRLLKRDAEWASIVSEGRDVEGMLAFWTDDAVVLRPVCRRSWERWRSANMSRRSPDSGIQDYVDVYGRAILAGR